MREIARRLKIDRLDKLSDRNDKLVNRLFLKKIELLIEKKKNYLYRCVNCNMLFTIKQQKILHCPASGPGKEGEEYWAMDAALTLR